LIKKDAIFDVNSIPRDYQLKGGYVMVWSIFGVNVRKRLQNLQSSVWAVSNGDLGPKLTPGRGLMVHGRGPE